MLRQLGRAEEMRSGLVIAQRVEFSHSIAAGSRGFSELLAVDPV
jgi:hypothetical protein